MSGWKWLTESIPAGRKEAVSMRYLAKIHGLTEREIRRAIEQARRDGMLICSSEQGYFLPETVQEIRAYTRRMSARIRTGRECLEPFLIELERAGGKEC